MASGYTATLTTATWRKIRGYCTWSTSTTSDTRIACSMTGQAQETQSYQYGCRIDIAIDQPSGTGKASDYKIGHLTSNPGSSWKNVGGQAKCSWSADRRTAAYTVYFRARLRGATSSGYGAFPGDTGWSTMGTASIAKLPVYTPNAPTNVKHTRNSDSQNTVTWTVNGATTRPYTGQELQVSIGGGAAQNVSTSIGANTTSYVHTGRSANTSYRYRVRSKNSAGASAWSAWTTTTYNTPTAPSGLSAAASGTNALLTWSSNSFSITRTEIQRATNSAFTAGLATIYSGAAKSSHTDATGGGVYYYRVRNVCSGGTTAWSNTAAVTTMMAPNAPTNFRRTPGATDSYVLTWTNNATTERPWSTIEVQRSANNSTWVAQSTIGGTLATTTVNLASLGSGPWYFRIRATNPIGNSAWVSIGPFYGAAPGLGGTAGTGTLSANKATTTASWSFTPGGFAGNLSVEVQQRVANWVSGWDTDESLLTWGSWTASTGSISGSTVTSSVNHARYLVVQYRARLTVVNPPDGLARVGSWVNTNAVEVRFAPLAATNLAYNSSTYRFTFRLPTDSVGSAQRTVKRYENGAVVSTATYTGTQQDVTVDTLPGSYFTEQIGITTPFWPSEVKTSVLIVNLDNSEITIGGERYTVFIVYDDGRVVPAAATVI